MNFTFSNFVNARSIRVGLEALGEELWALDAPGFMVPQARRQPLAGDRLFFTDEASLARYWDRAEFTFEPRNLSLPMDDKLAFALAAEAAGVKPVPYASIDDAHRIGFPLLLKGRHSWRDGKSQPRGCIVRSVDELLDALARYALEGCGRDSFFLQRWLPDGVTNCWSVAGWFSAGEAIGGTTIITRKLLATRAGLGYAVAVGTVEDSAGLRERTGRILSALRYRGPFELEYLEGEPGVFYALELNPRFWLQHSIIVHGRNNFLLRRYLGLPTKPADESRPLLWVSGIGLVLAAMRPWQAESWRLAKEIRTWRRRGAMILTDPPFPVAMRVLLQQASARVSMMVRGMRS